MTDIPAISAASRRRETADPGWSQALAGWAMSRLAAGETPLLDDALPEFERTLIREALKAAQRRSPGSRASARLGRNTLTRKLKDLGMDDL